MKHLARIVERIRGAWPDVEIVIRGDSGFCREELMRWCESHGVGYLFGLAKNRRLLGILGKELHEAQLLFEQTGKAARVFQEFSYRTRKSWSRERRMIGKAEHLEKGSNPRFVVTSLPAEKFAAQELSGGTVGGGHRRTASRNNSCVCSLIARAVGRCGPISSAWRSRQWPTFCCGLCQSSA